MMYEPYKRRNKRSRRDEKKENKLPLYLGKLLLGALLLAALCLLGLWLMPAGLFSLEPEADLSLSADLPVSPINILLLGLDEENDGLRRSDAMLIVSLDNSDVRLTSLLRDTEAEIPGRGLGRINSAWTYGGAELALRTVNQNFSMNIMHYIAADYRCLVDLVDALGGVELDITQAEMEQINVNVKSSAHIFKPLGYTCAELTAFGEKTHLNGLQALGFARIRKTDSDFTRASRQRQVLAAMWRKLQYNLWNPALLIRLARTAFASVESDLSPAQLVSLALKAALAGEVTTLRLPAEGSYTDTQAALQVNDWPANRAALRAFIYGGRAVPTADQP